MAVKNRQHTDGKVRCDVKNCNVITGVIIIGTLFYKATRLKRRTIPYSPFLMLSEKCWLIQSVPKYALGISTSYVQIYITLEYKLTLYKVQTVYIFRPSVILI